MYVPGVMCTTRPAHDEISAPQPKSDIYIYKGDRKEQLPADRKRELAVDRSLI